MLILVLVLVAIALAFWIAGWFLQVVALFWTSVGICLLAGIVLFYDWWQTRSAERAGDRVESGPGTDGPAAQERAGLEARYGADMEPATQVLPVVRPEGASGPGAGPGGETPYASDATVQIPVVRPSGSPEGPSGVSRSSGSSSPSVTDDAEPAVAGSAAGHPPVDGGEGGPDGTGRGGDPDRPGATPEPATTDADAGGPSAAGSAGAGPPGAPGGPASAGSVVTGAVAAGAAGAGGGPDGTGERTADREPGFGSGDANRTTGTPPQGDPAGATTAQAVPDEAGATGGASAPGSTAAGVAVAGAPADGTDRGTAAEQVPADGDAPEEPHDPTLAGLVARLPDEVLVIDEHPRYHVPACRTLSGRPVIPLPVSEAVELGFTPCGWCSPNRTLGERHGAQVR